MAKAQTESEPDLAHRIRTLQAAIDEKRARLSEMTERLDAEWSQLPDSNRRPADYKSAPLPTELSWPFTIPKDFRRAHSIHKRSSRKGFVGESFLTGYSTQ